MLYYSHLDSITLNTVFAVSMLNMDQIRPKRIYCLGSLEQELSFAANLPAFSLSDQQFFSDE